MPEAKCPYFSSVNPIIPKGSCFMLNEKVATWSSNVGPVQLLFALYVKPNGGGEGRVGRWQLMAWILWYRDLVITCWPTTWQGSTQLPLGTLLAVAVVQQPPRNPSLSAGTSQLCPMRGWWNGWNRPPQSAHGADVLQALVTCRMSPGVQSVTSPICSHC